MKTYYSSIQLLRGIAALLVCIFHFTAHADIHGRLFALDSPVSKIGEYGALGVYIFFVITGFVIPLSMLREGLTIGNMPRFLLRRFVRIELPYLASIALIIVIHLIFSFKNHEQVNIDAGRLLAHLTYTVPFTGYEWYNIIFWTLAIEFQFYLLIGILLPLVSSGQNMKSTIALMVFGLMSFSIPDDRLVFKYAPVFMMGISLVLLHQKKLNRGSAWFLILTGALLTSQIFSAATAVFALLTVIAIHFTDWNFSSGNKLGDISFSLYLTHGCIGGNLLYLLSRHADSVAMQWLFFSAAMLLSLVFAWIFLRFIENPARNISRKIIIKKKA